ncbi:MAG TPA: hypothetical protein GX747_04510 [Tenericutes bacterium]|nr:hypothetical protein [Mycoplasmatota bacterium]
MGVFDKIRTMFTEEIEEETPIKKEVIQVEIPSPISESGKEEINKKEEVKKEEKFTFPVFFDDSDFEAIEKSKENNNIKKSQAYSKSKVQEKEPEKKFTPTPIISPVYGILDKNYHKEDITPKKVVVESTKKEDVTIDDVRKKAFGTLEDILENTLFGKIVFDDIENETKKEEKDLFYELEQLENKIHDKQEEENKNNTNTYNLEEDILTRSRNINKDNINSDIKTRVERNKHLEEQLQYDFENDTNNNTDLFNLIDSMYEKGDE